MNRQAFKLRMQNLKSYRENNPGKGYWDWKVEAFADGGVNDNLVGSYSNHTGTTTMYVPVTKEYEATPEGFGEIINVHTPEVTITPLNNISLVEAVDKGRRNAFEYIKEAASYTPIVGDAMGASDVVYQAILGNYSEAALAAGLMLLPNFIKKPLKRVGKLLKKNKKIISELQLDDVRNWTDSDWDSNYNLAINDGDKDKVLRIRDLHFMSKVPNNNISIRNGKPTTWFHGSPYAGHTTFNSSVFNNTIGGESALGREKGNFFTTDLNAAKNYAIGPSAKSEFSEYTKPKNAKEKILDVIGLYEPKYTHPVDRIPEDLGIDVKNMHNYEVSPLLLINMSGSSNYKAYQSNKIYPAYINPGKTYTVDFEGNPWSQSPVEFPSKYYSRETYPDVDLVPSKNYPEGHFVEKRNTSNLSKDLDELKLELNSLDLPYNKVYYDGSGNESLYGKYRGWNSKLEPKNLISEYPDYRTRPGYSYSIFEHKYPNTTNGAVLYGASENFNTIHITNVVDANTGHYENYPIEDLIPLSSNLIKLANPITYDNSGKIIPISKRDNFTNPDIRYGLIPLIGFSALNYNNNSSAEEYKNRKYSEGGEVNEFLRKTRAELMREAAAGGRPSYEGMFQKQNEYQKDFAKYWYTERAKNPQYASQIGGEKLKLVLDNIEKATWKTPTEAMRDNLTNLGYTPAEEQIKQLVDILKENGTRGFANPKSHSYSTFGLKSTWHEGVGHMVGDNTPSILQATPNIHISNSDASFEEYVNQDNEKHAQTWDFRGNNANLKDDQGNYFIDPNRLLTPEDIGNMRKKGAEIPDQWLSLDDNEISELTNTFAYNMSLDPIQYMVNGGETGDPDENFVRAVNAKLGRTPDGRPKEQGLKNTMEFRDMLDFTPVGDVLAAKDTYDAVKANDWVGAGLAALSMLPFVPSGLRAMRSASRYVPSVNKELELRMLNSAFDGIKERRAYLSDVANERNRILESVNDYAHRVRAQKADQMFGTNYNETYDLLSDLYEHNFFSLPEVQAKDMLLIGKMLAKLYAEEKFNKTGIGAGPEDFDFLVNPYRMINAKELARHEMNHYTDYIISRNINTATNNNMLKQLEKSLKLTKETEYFKTGTEQKAYMNQLRTRMYEDGAISSLEEPVSSALIKTYLDKLGNKDSIKRAYKQHKSLSSYTKWFNSIPLLGVGAIGANHYFNNNETKQEK